MRLLNPKSLNRKTYQYLAEGENRKLKSGLRSSLTFHPLESLFERNRIVRFQNARLKRIVTALAIILLASPAVWAQRKRARQPAIQTSFGSETPIRRPSKLPKDVLQQLVNENTEQLKRCLETDGGSDTDLQEYFVASMIDINNDGHPDLLVQAGKYCLQGAHNTAFWIFTKADQEIAPGYKLVFSKQTDWIDVLKTSTNGYRDIQAADHTAIEIFTTVWKFNGSKYQPRACSVENLQTHKVVRVKCFEE